MYIHAETEKKCEEKRCEAEYIVDPDGAPAALVCLISPNENTDFEVSFIKRFALFPLNEEDIPKPVYHKYSDDIFKW